MAKKNSDLIPGAKNLKALRGALEHSVTIQMTRLQEVIDDLVTRGSLTRAEADKLIDQLVSTSKAYTHALLEVVETVSVETRKNIEAGLTSATAPVKATAKKLKGKVTGKPKENGKKSKGKKAGKTGGKSAKVKAAIKVPAVRVKLPTVKPKPVAKTQAQAVKEPKLALVQQDPIPNLADLSIAKIRPLLAGLTPAELNQVRGQEAAGKARVSLIAEIDRSLKG
ncbi:hypothetical protein [Nocardioides sp. WS12]|uniref:hypothetical protein n=1 Tax=Nocardioides sp. WS12 TaxID=2486272 RepID=UPI0015FDC55C|nr:hypothetical protein [Nocardioides sp. WS12]